MGSTTFYIYIRVRTIMSVLYRELSTSGNVYTYVQNYFRSNAKNFQKKRYISFFFKRWIRTFIGFTMSRR